MRTRLLPIVVVPAVLDLLAVLFASGGLSGNNFDEITDPTAVLRQPGVPDSIAQRWNEPYIPLWALTQEAPVPPHVKEYIIAKNEGNTLVTDNFTGVRCRVLKNKFAETLTQMGKDGADRWQIMKFGVGKIRKAYVEGDLEWGSVVCGQVCGLIREIPTCRELIESIVEEAEETMASVETKVRPSVKMPQLH